MKKLSIITLFLFYGFFLSQQGIKFENDTFTNILEKAKKENKLVFLDAYASWCGPCKLLEKNVFSKKEVGDFYNATFVNAHFDMEKGEGVDIARKYKIYSYPTLIFLNGNGDVVYKAAGYMPSEEFLKIGKEAGNPENTLENKIAKFNAGESNLEFLMGLIKNTFSSDFPLAQKVATRYFNVKTDQELSQEEVGMILFFTKSTEDELYTILNNKKTEISKHIPESFLVEFDKQLKVNTVLQKSFDKNTQILNEEKFITEATQIFGEKEAKKMLAKINMDKFFTQKNYIEYAKAAIIYYQNPSEFDINELNNISWNFYLYITDKSMLQHAVNWCLESIKKKENNFNTDTLANIYYKLGDMKNAKIWAQKSIAIAKANNDDYQSTEDLLKRIK